MDLKCPFAAPLTKGDFGCRHAKEVVRRGGSEIDCRSAADHERCRELFLGLKRAALPAFEVEDDLTTMPHSVLVKIQYGGLLGLQRLIREGAAPDAIEDVSMLVSEVQASFGALPQVPYERLLDDMTSFRLQRKTRRR